MDFICYFKALQLGNVNKVTLIDKSSTVVTIAFSYFYLKEKMSKKAIVGFIMIIIGTMLLLVK